MTRGMKFFNYNRALCLSPHPDDVEYSMGGTVLKHSGTLFDIVCLSKGGDCDATTDLLRLEEMAEYWRRSGCDNVSVHYGGANFVKDLAEDRWVNILETRFTTQVDYDVIFTPPSSDSHFEHKITNNLAAPLSRLERISIVEYCSPSTLEDWIPNLYIDISVEFATKLAALKAFETQGSRKYFTEATIRNFNSNFRCSKRGMNYVEQFRINQIYEPQTSNSGQTRINGAGDGVLISEPGAGRIHSLAMAAGAQSQRRPNSAEL